jgi:hypothetical protein
MNTKSILPRRVGVGAIERSDERDGIEALPRDAIDVTPPTEKSSRQMRKNVDGKKRRESENTGLNDERL